MARSILDMKGLICPLPVLRANKAMKSLSRGDELEVHVTDPAAPADFDAYSRTTGHALLEHREEEGYDVVVLRKS
ncbi:MAG: sulfurtransferase TusA family protein [Rhodospirillales bacterium]